MGRIMKRSWGSREERIKRNRSKFEKEGGGGWGG
jgi:hypothetical protein